MARPIVAVALAFFLLTTVVDLAQAPSALSQVRQEESWTIMVYMADDFSSSLMWQNDLNEMEAAQQAPGTTVIALVDPYGANNSVLYKIEHDPNFLDETIVSSLVNDNGSVISGGEVNMAASSTLGSFITFSMLTYPADNSVLVLWGHGAGWRGLCPDGTDILTLPKLSDGLSQATLAIGHQLDLIIVDSCAEAAVETLWQIHDYARYFMASENDVPFQGLPYNIVLDDLASQPDQGVAEFASKIADDYVLWSSSYTDYSVTMGVFNLSEMEALIGSLNELSIQSQKYDPIFHESLRNSFNASETYEEDFSVDFGHFMMKLTQADLPLEVRYHSVRSLLAAKEVVEHIAKYTNPVAINGITVTNASGFTIYAPNGDFSAAQYSNTSLGTTPWRYFGELLRNNTTPVENGPGPTINYESLETANDSVTLGWPDGTERVTVAVFWNQSGGLHLVAAMDSSGQSARLTGILGPLTLATSSYRNGSLYSYRTINVTLHGSVGIAVSLMRDDLPVVDSEDKYDITLITSEGEIRTNTSEPNSSYYLHQFNIRIPEDALVGEIVFIRVTDSSTGKVVSEKRIFVPAEDTSAQVDASDYCECPYRLVVPLIFALLPGLLILAFALSLHYENRRREKDKGKKG